MQGEKVNIYIIYDIDCWCAVSAHLQYAGTAMQILQGEKPLGISSARSGCIATVACADEWLLQRRTMPIFFFMFAL